MLSNLLSLFISQIKNTENDSKLSPFLYWTQLNQTQEVKIIDYLPSTRPYITAEASLVYDIEQNLILHQHNQNQKLPIASLTKLMTAIIILEQHQLTEKVKVSSVIQNIQPSKMNLRLNEELTIEDLLAGLLIESANDAAFVLAEHNSGDINKFVEKMNAKAKVLGLKNSKFNNPAGFDNDNNYSTIIDLLTLSKEAISKPELIKLSTQKTKTTKSISGEQHILNSTNNLLETSFNVSGLKTGTTINAGQCLITVSQTDGKKLLTIVLNSKNRFNDTKTLIDWANYHLTTPK
jgi:D-alanyl-D-alanine carboxypeptidase